MSKDRQVGCLRIEKGTRLLEQPPQGVMRGAFNRSSLVLSLQICVDKEKIVTLGLTGGFCHRSTALSAAFGAGAFHESLRELDTMNQHVSHVLWT